MLKRHAILMFIETRVNRSTTGPWTQPIHRFLVGEERVQFDEALWPNLDRFIEGPLFERSLS